MDRWADDRRSLPWAVFCENCTDTRYPVFIGLDSIDSALAGLNSTVQTWGYNSVCTIGLSGSVSF